MVTASHRHPGRRAGEAAVLALLDAHGELAQLAALNRSGHRTWMAMDCARRPRPTCAPRSGVSCPAAPRGNAILYGQPGASRPGSGAHGVGGAFSGPPRPARPPHGSLRRAGRDRPQSHGRGPPRSSPRTSSAGPLGIDAEIPRPRRNRPAQPHPVALFRLRVGEARAFTPDRGDPACLSENRSPGAWCGIAGVDWRSSCFSRLPPWWRDPLPPPRPRAKLNGVVSFPGSAGAGLRRPDPPGPR